jgi:hypothetical protein
MTTQDDDMTLLVARYRELPHSRDGR